MGRRADDTGGPGPSRNAPPLHPGSSGEAQSPLRKGVLDAVCVCFRLWFAGKTMKLGGNLDKYIRV